MSIALQPTKTCLLPSTLNGPVVAGASGASSTTALWLCHVTTWCTTRCPGHLRLGKTLRDVDFPRLPLLRDMVPPRRYDSSSTLVTASRLFSRPLLSSIHFLQSPRTRPLPAAHAFAAPSHTVTFGSVHSSRTRLLLRFSRQLSPFRNLSSIPFRRLPTLGHLSAALAHGRLSSVFAFSQFSRTGSLVAAIALPFSALSRFGGAFHSHFTIPFPSHTVPHAFAFLQPSTFVFTHGRLFPAFASGGLPARGYLWQLLSFPSLLARGHFLLAVDFSIFSHTVPCGSLRLLASHTWPLWAAFAFRGPFTHGPLWQPSPSSFSHTVALGSVRLSQSLHTQSLAAAPAPSRSSRI